MGTMFFFKKGGSANNWKYIFTASCLCVLKNGHSSLTVGRQWEASGYCGSTSNRNGPEWAEMNRNEPEWTEMEFQFQVFWNIKFI